MFGPCWKSGSCECIRSRYLKLPELTLRLNRNSDTFGHLPWLADDIRKPPGLGAKMKEMRSFCIQRTVERVKLGNTSRKDLFYYLVSVPPLVRHVLSSATELHTEQRGRR